MNTTNVVNILEAPSKRLNVAALLPPDFPFQEDFGGASSLLASIANENIVEHLGLIGGELAVLADLRRQRASSDCTPGAFITLALDADIKRSQENVTLLQTSIAEMTIWAREAVRLMHEATDWAYSAA
ncbi:hypothetical protein EUV02_03975 [Polymorphobacter arshaanensis]|uniref:Uncharacterized protein n=1 Tax=Glacieibacterium arshaanense TaxID=2511025 RepID=A0A4Y9ESJ5_9SPHN|nr:hypothetical protein [Polymorphobacter arshaanensis]TFU06179.1 hypothetical protein EUV02_03975 [Polymorphobacter arshaanensis]